jgi:hypothetical protein
MLAAHGHLAKVANGEPLFPRLHLADPVFAADVEGLPSALKNVVGEIAGKVKGKAGVKTLTKFKASKTFFNFAPCVLQETHVSWMGGGEKRAREREREREGERETTMRSPPPGPLGPLTSSPRPALTHRPTPHSPLLLQTGFVGHLEGLNFAPELFGFHPTIGRASFSALQIAPKLIFVNPMGLQVQPQGEGEGRRAGRAGRAPPSPGVRGAANLPLVPSPSLFVLIFFPPFVSLTSPLALSPRHHPPRRQHSAHPGVHRCVAPAFVFGERERERERETAAEEGTKKNPLVPAAFFHSPRLFLFFSFSLFLAGPIGANVQPQGVNVQPIKLNIAPMKKVIAPAGKVVAPAKLVYAPTKVLYNPRKGPVYAPVGQDLAAMDKVSEFGQTEGGDSVVGNTATVP